MPDRQLDFGPESETPAAKAGIRICCDASRKTHVARADVSDPDFGRAAIAVIASEAKQSILSLRLYGLLRYARNDDVRSQSRGAMRPSCA